ncbi:protein of unknown function [Burkholderia multivorans]
MLWGLPTASYGSKKAAGVVTHGGLSLAKH